MIHLIIVNYLKSWPIEIPGVEVVQARAYLSDDRYAGIRNAKVYNLCRSYHYQSIGYYVSLLASARGHKPIPENKRYRFDLAILTDPDEETPPSDEKAVQRFIRAAEAFDFYTERITRQDYARLNEFDALFIRVTTSVNHYSY